MAPRTRSAAAKKGTPMLNASITLNGDSTSSAPTPATTASDGESSTPATSNAQTPAPAAKSKTRIVIELPEIPSESSSGKSKNSGQSNSSDPPKSTRRRSGPFYVHDSEDDDDYDDYFPGDRSRGAVVARKIQREQDTMTMTPFTKKSQPAKAKTARGRKRPRVVLSLESEDDDEWEDIFSDYYSDEYPMPTPDPARTLALARKMPKMNKTYKRQKLSALVSDEEADTDYPDDVDIRFASAREIRSYMPKHRYRDKDDFKRRVLELRHPNLVTMWTDLEQMPLINPGTAPQPANITRTLKPFQRIGLAWMQAMEGRQWKGGVLGDEMGLGKTIQAVSLIMSDYPAKTPTLVLAPPVALMQWIQEIESYTSGQLKTLMYHGTNPKAKKMTLKELRKFDVIIMSYPTLETMYRKQEKGVFKNEGTYKEKSLMHQIKFHRVILDEAHCIKTRGSGTAKACFALTATYRWCLSGTPLQNRIGEFFSLLRFLRVVPFVSYICKACPCEHLEWAPDRDSKCPECEHAMVMHVSVFNQEILNPICNDPRSDGEKKAFKKLQLLTSRLMLRRLKKDHMSSMELPVKEIYLNRQFFSEEEADFASSIMNNSQRKFDTYVAQGVVLNNYANIFGLLMQMRQVADHPDMILKKNSEGGQNVLVCCICDEPAEEAIRSKCKHDFCRSCAKSYVNSQDDPDCPRCHIPLSIDLEQPDIEQDAELMKKSSIINRIKMENWKSSSKIELLILELYRLRSDKMCHKSIIFSQFTSMLQLIQWRLQRAGISTVMLDGSMNPAQKQASIDHFMNNVEVECFLVSLKAGGVALNLTEASRVFIVDPWWNPAAEWQSADRCHRIGQTRPCIITRFCIEDSVESRMVLLQEKKSKMIQSTVNAGGDIASMELLSREDMEFLFRIG
ncbi:SNF2 family N-terminal domain-containing protein [Annulohypoxylon bovei var. microspora]|nr:SNF2 family N-terminal domain-containing protein [Annulohypoxylon bovei var. microspora]